MRQRTFATSETVDFVVIGAGAAGGILAKELAAAGHSVVVLEQGPWRRNEDFRHDELANWFLSDMMPPAVTRAQTFRASEDEVATTRQIPPIWYAGGVGGSSVHFTANYWRFRPSDFRERSLLGTIAGTGFDDWPVTYEEMEPYYTRVEWEIGVSGEAGPFDPPRSRPFPMPPLPVKSSGALLERGAARIGVHAQPAPMAIASQAYDGRAGCIHCGFCMGYGCEVGAKSSTLVAMIPKAVATGNCEIRTDCTVHRVETDARGRATGALYWDAAGREQRQPARGVVLAANGAETARLLLLSTTPQFPEGLANSSGLVGRYLMCNGNASTYGAFEHPSNEYKSVQVTRIIMDWYENDARRGFYGGGGIDARLSFGPILFALEAMPPDAPRWGAGFVRELRELYTRTIELSSHSTSLPLERNSISLDPVLRDSFGRPALRMTYRDHDDDLAMLRFLQQRSVELLDAAGARRTWVVPAAPTTITAHLLGTARMGDDPRGSVVDRYHRAHDVPNLWICDGSSFVTSGRGQPTMTIQALAFRAADHIVAGRAAGGS